MIYPLGRAFFLSAIIIKLQAGILPLSWPSGVFSQEERLFVGSPFFHLTKVQLGIWNAGFSVCFWGGTEWDLCFLSCTMFLEAALKPSSSSAFKQLPVARKAFYVLEVPVLRCSCSSVFGDLPLTLSCPLLGLFQEGPSTQAPSLGLPIWGLRQVPGLSLARWWL